MSRICYLPATTAQGSWWGALDQPSVMGMIVLVTLCAGWSALCCVLALLVISFRFIDGEGV